MFKIKKSKLFEKQEKCLSKKEKKELRKSLKAIAKDPYKNTEPATKEEILALIFEEIMYDYDIDEIETFSLILSNEEL